MIDVDEAYEVLFAKVGPGAITEMPLGAALYRTLAAPIRCDMDQPPFDRAVMDGYAVRAADVAAAPVTLKVIGQAAAGASPPGPVSVGQAVQINTGAPVPLGVDAVVPVEDTEPSSSDGEVLIGRPAPVGQFITPRGTFTEAGGTVLDAGTRLTPLATATAAAAGAVRVMVYRRPTVAVLSTGDELVDPGERPVGAQIRNCNQYLLAALITAAHAEPVMLGVARDDRDSLRVRIVEGLRSDVLCITGGVSKGAFDFVPEVLEACGAEFHIRRMAIKPGRPTIFATARDGKLIFALPGNPASAFVGFELLGKPALAALEGRAHQEPRLFRATLRGSVKRASQRRGYVPARAWVSRDGEWEVEPLSWHGSGDAFGLATANALIVRPPRAEVAGNGEAVLIHLLDQV